MLRCQQLILPLIKLHYHQKHQAKLLHHNQYPLYRYLLELGSNRTNKWYLLEQVGIKSFKQVMETVLWLIIV